MASAACWRLVSIRVMFEWSRGLHSIASIWPAEKYVKKRAREERLPCLIRRYKERRLFYFSLDVVLKI